MNPPTDSGAVHALQAPSLASDPHLGLHAKFDAPRYKSYMANHELGSANPLTSDGIKKLLIKLEEESSAVIYLAKIEDSKGGDHYYLCKYAVYQAGWIQDFDILPPEATASEPKFDALIRTLGQGGIKKMGAHNARLYSFDASGNTRIKFT